MGLLSTLDLVLEVVIITPLSKMAINGLKYMLVYLDE
jgi:hypothetical protein